MPGDTFVEGSDTSLTSHTPTGADAATAWVTGQAGAAALVLEASDLCRDDNTSSANTFKITDDLGSDEQDVQLDVSFANAAVDDFLFAGPMGRTPNATAGESAGFTFRWDWAQGTNGVWELSDNTALADSLDEAYPGGAATMLLEIRDATQRGLVGGVEKVSISSSAHSGNQFAGANLGNFTGDTSKRSQMDNYSANAAASGAADFEATGDLDAQAATISGAGLHHRTSTGALIVQAPTIAGVAVVGRMGTGGLTAQAPTIDGAGVVGRAGTGALTVGSPVLLGAGVVGRAAEGTLAVRDATVSGAATVNRTATGALQAQDAAISGDGTFSGAPEVAPTARVRDWRRFIN